ncbi:MAG: glycosyltransferase [Thermoproteota archaeon]
MPTYNEAANIPELLERVETSLKGLEAEIVFVDDNSPDGTAELAETLGEKYGNVKVLKRPYKMGLGSAVLHGVKLAEAEFVAVMDADLQHPPELLPEMLEKVKQGYVLAVASRYVEGGSKAGASGGNSSQNVPRSWRTSCFRVRGRLRTLYRASS